MYMLTMHHWWDTVLALACAQGGIVSVGPTSSKKGPAKPTKHGTGTADAPLTQEERR